LQLVAGDDRHGDRHVGQALLAALCGDHHFVQACSRIAGLAIWLRGRRRLLRVQRCADAERAQRAADSQNIQSGFRWIHKYFPSDSN
jgi:hypothetical protein